MGENFNQIVGLNLRGAREEKGWTQESLGRLCGYSGSAISKLESGRTRITIEQLRLLSDTLGELLADLVKEKVPL